MRFDFTVQAATFVARPNRFVVHAQLDDGQVVRCHCADPGRLQELLLPRARMYVSRAAQTGSRRTDYDLRFVHHPSTNVLVSLDTRIPNQLVGEALRRRDLAPFRDIVDFQAEVAAPVRRGKVRSRFDFRAVDKEGAACWIEVKSVTLVEDGVALFPDAPTARGRRHLEELIEVVESGLGRAAVVFVIQRDDATVLRPHVERDPDFAAALFAAHAAGVELYPYTCTLTTEEILLRRPVPLIIDQGSPPTTADHVRQM